MRVLTDKIALIRRPRSRNAGPEIAVNIYSTLTGTAPKLMLDLESEDYGVLEGAPLRLRP